MKLRTIFGALLFCCCLVFIAGCGQAYRLSASGWATTLTDIQTKMTSVGNDLNQHKGRVVTDPKLREQTLTRLSEAETMINDLKAKLPASGPEHHTKLTTGLDELLGAIAKARQGIETKNSSLFKQFQDEAGAASQKISEWGEKVRNNE